MPGATGELQTSPASVASTLGGAATTGVSTTSVTTRALSSANTVIRHLAFVSPDPWNEQLADSTSRVYQEREKNTTRELSIILSRYKTFAGLRNTLFRPGSVVTETDAVFSNSPSPAPSNEDVVNAVGNSIISNNNMLGSTPVDVDNITSDGKLVSSDDWFLTADTASMQPAVNPNAGIESAQMDTVNFKTTLLNPRRSIL
ncbi:hypothetical protein NDU88_007625 [Pleurodeles waltl]|uniref:SEA domain-containing protein n=1 Tax=Pleurodeles waltl TaxID=8319 RepID=A0AAV7ST15_PLEWA|nr:hypothetical protein NDU88_007625 [Pleurodeles waltl]